MFAAFRPGPGAASLNPEATKLPKAFALNSLCSQHRLLCKTDELPYITDCMVHTNSGSFDDQTKAAKDSRDGARDDRAHGRACQLA